MEIVHSADWDYFHDLKNTKKETTYSLFRASRYPPTVQPIQASECYEKNVPLIIAKIKCNVNIKINLYFLVLHVYYILYNSIALN